jgi:hypothetical protein
MPTKKSKNSVESSESVDASVSESGNKPFYLPETKSCISDSTSDYWGLTVTVNKRLWRSLLFREQALVNNLIGNLQEGLEGVLSAKFLQLLEKHASSLAEEKMEPIAEVLPVVDPATGELNFEPV